jgi:NitT/TauT family transport system permease protein
MVAASESGGLGQRLVYFSSLVEMDSFGAVIVIIAALGVGIYVLFYLLGKRWASWEA